MWVLKITKIKESILILTILTLLIVSLPDCLAQSNVVINEFESDPPGNDSDVGNEWVELYNPTTSSIDISNWKIIPTSNEANTIILSEGAIIRANGYYIVSYSTQFLDNNAEAIILQDATGNEIDRTPSKTDTNNNEEAWARHPNGIDTDNDNDWIFQQSTKSENNNGEETYGQPEPSPTETPTPPPSTAEPTEQTPTESPETSPDTTPIPTRSSQMGNLQFYILIAVSTVAALLIAIFYIFKVYPSRMREIDYYETRM